MFQTINKIGNKVSKTILATAAAAGLGYASNAFGVAADVTAIQTQFTSGPATTVFNVSGYGDAGTGFLPTNTYTMHYAGGDLAVTKITANGTDYTPIAQGTATVRRNSVAPNTDILWYTASGNINTANGSTINMQGPALSGYNAAFSGNNLLVGGDNLFANQGNGHGNNTDVERLDIVYSGGLTTDISKIFTVFDRGLDAVHDGFKIAAITTLDGSGNPSNYGPLISVSKGSYGNTDLLAAQGYAIVRKNDNIAGDPFHPADQTVQPIGGVAINTTDLAASGSVIYGYSLFAPDTTGSGVQLVNWTNSTFFPANTGESTIGGLDPLTDSAVYSAIPEPTSLTLLAVGAGAMLARRPRRNRA